MSGATSSVAGSSLRPASSTDDIIAATQSTCGVWSVSLIGACDGAAASAAVAHHEVAVLAGVDVEQPVAGLGLDVGRVAPARDVALEVVDVVALVAHVLLRGTRSAAAAGPGCGGDGASTTTNSTRMTSISRLKPEKRMLRSQPPAAVSRDAKATGTRRVGDSRGMHPRVDDPRGGTVTERREARSRRGTGLCAGTASRTWARGRSSGR